MSEFMNIILGGGLVGTVATIGSLRATVRKAKAEAMKAEAGAEAMRIDNCPHRDDCPVLDRLRESPKEHEPGSPDGNGKRRQRERKSTGGTGDGGGTGEFGEADYTGGQPP